MPNRFSTETKGFDQNILERRLQSKLTAEIIDYSQFQSMFLRTLNNKKVSDNKNFWKSVKPIFSHNGLNSNNILLGEVMKQ